MMYFKHSFRLVFKILSWSLLVLTIYSPLKAQQPTPDHCNQYSKIIELIVNDSIEESRVYRLGAKPHIVDSVKNLSNFMVGRLLPWAALYSIEQKRELNEVSGGEISNYIQNHSLELLNNDLFHINCEFTSFSAPSFKIQFYRLNDYCVLANAFVDSETDARVQHSFGKYYLVQFAFNNSFEFRQWSWQE